jgi:hypothetical protein
MKPMVQIDYKFLLCKHFKLAKKHTISNICRKTITSQILRTKGMARKNNFTLESIIFYNPQKDKNLLQRKKSKTTKHANNLIPKKSVLNINNENWK